MLQKPGAVINYHANNASMQGIVISNHDTNTIRVLNNVVVH